jgi:hypothetical protein
MFEYGVDVGVANAASGPMLMVHTIAFTLSLWFMITIFIRQSLHQLQYYSLLGHTITDSIWCLWNIWAGIMQLVNGSGLYQGNCQISGFFTLYVIAGSVSSLCLVAWTRRQAIIHAALGTNLTTNWLLCRQIGVLIICIILVWGSVMTSSGMVVSPSGRYCWSSLAEGESAYPQLVVWIACAVLVASCYISVYRRVVKARQLTITNLRDDQIRHRVSQEGVLAWRMVMVLTVFIIAYIPSTVQSIACGMEMRTSCGSGMLDLMTEISLLLHVIATPIMYIGMDLKLRNEAFIIVQQCCCCYVSPNNDDQEAPYDIKIDIAAPRTAWEDQPDPNATTGTGTVSPGVDNNISSGDVNSNAMTCPHCGQLLTFGWPDGNNHNSGDRKYPNINTNLDHCPCLALISPPSDLYNNSSKVYHHNLHVPANSPTSQIQAPEPWIPMIHVTPSGSTATLTKPSTPNMDSNDLLSPPHSLVSSSCIMAPSPPPLPLQLPITLTSTLRSSSTMSTNGASQLSNNINSLVAFSPSSSPVPITPPLLPLSSTNETTGPTSSSTSTSMTSSSAAGITNSNMVVATTSSSSNNDLPPGWRPSSLRVRTLIAEASRSRSASLYSPIGHAFVDDD